MLHLAGVEGGADPFTCHSCCHRAATRAANLPSQQRSDRRRTALAVLRTTVWRRHRPITWKEIRYDGYRYRPGPSAEVIHRDGGEHETSIQPKDRNRVATGPQRLQTLAAMASPTRHLACCTRTRLLVVVGG